MWITVQVRQTDSSSFMLEAGWKSYQQVNRVPLTGYDRSWGLTQVPFQSWRQQKNKTNKSKTHLIWFNLNILLKLWNSFKLLFIWSFIIALLNHTHTHLVLLMDKVPIKAIKPQTFLYTLLTFVVLFVPTAAYCSITPDVTVQMDTAGDELLC